MGSGTGGGAAAARSGKGLAVKRRGCKKAQAYCYVQRSLAARMAVTRTVPHGGSSGGRLPACPAPEALASSRALCSCAEPAMPRGRLPLGSLVPSVSDPSPPTKVRRDTPCFMFSYPEGNVPRLEPEGSVQSCPKATEADPRTKVTSETD